MTTPTQIDIISYLLKEEKPQNIRGIARSLKKSYALVYNNIEDLRRKEIILKQNLPPAQIISLNKHAPVELLIEAEKRRKHRFLQKNKWAKVFLKDVLSHAKTKFFTLIIFGSYVRGKQTEKSDLDILVIVPKKEYFKEMERALNNAYTKIKKHIVIVDELDFIEMINKPNQLNVGNEVLKNHILLYGAEQYYQLVEKSNEQ